MSKVEQEQSQLPKGWAETKIGDICDLINGRAFKPSEWATSGIPIIRIQNLNDPHAEFNYCNFDVEQKYLVENGQLLFAWSGTPGTSFGAHIWNRGQAVLNQHIFKVLINEKYLDKTFLKNLFNCNVKEYVGKAHGTAGLAHITKGKFEESKILLPPFNEQKRITNKVELLFSYLDAGVAQLRTVQAQLKRYRQAVLKAAFEGKLTQQWREEHKDQIEPAQKLKDGLDDSLALPELPIGWAWTKLGEICESVDRIDPRANPEKEFLYLEIASIDNSKQKITKHTRYYGRDAPSRARQVVKTGDILFSTVRTYLKNIALVDSQYDKQIASTGFCVLRPSLKIKSRLLFHFVQKSDLLNTLNKIQRGTSYPAVRDSDVFEQPFPLPPLAEQDVIIEEIDRLLSVADTVMAIVENGAKKADVLRQSILKNAFEGNLVSQDPSDEPAERLLDRIKAEHLTNKSKNNQLELSQYVK